MIPNRWWRRLTQWLRPGRRPGASAGATLRATAAANLPARPVTTARAPVPLPASNLMVAGVAEAVAQVPVDPPELQPASPAFVAWLLALPTPPGPAAANRSGAPELPPHPAGLHMIAQLDRVIASDALCSQLLPRAPDVVPRLMKTLRDESYSSVDVAQRISRDLLLTAEVIRMASNSVLRNGEDSPDLPRAVAVIGTQGLRRAIARVVVRPLFDARADTLLARAAPQIWEDADKKSRLCLALAAGLALDPLDAYLAGLLHNTGWTAALRAIDGLDDTLVPPPAAMAHPEIIVPLLARRDKLFAKMLTLWQISDPLAQLADEIFHGGLGAAKSPLAELLRQAQGLAALHTLQAGGALAGGVVAPATLAPAVSEAYVALSTT